MEKVLREIVEALRNVLRPQQPVPAPVRIAPDYPRYPQTRRR